MRQFQRGPCKPRDICSIPLIQMTSAAPKAWPRGKKLLSYAGLSKSTGVPASTLWRRARGKPSRKEKAANQQYLTPQEEQALVEYVLRMANNGYPLPVKFLRSLAWIIARQRSSNVLIPASNTTVRPPGKN
jgi:hypothetical protein